jgi:hypothetical protein
VPTWARAYAQGQWSVAIELLQAMPEASLTAWHWLHLARALEKRSRLVEAFGAYERLHDLAAEGAALPGMSDVSRQAKTESGALSHRIPWAEVQLGRGLPAGALVFVDQQWLEPARLRSPYPVNPGWHTFLVESNGVVLAARRTFFEEGQSRLVPLTGFDGSATSAASLSAAAEPNLVHGEAEAELGGASSAPGRRALTWRPSEGRLEADRHQNLLPAAYVSLAIGAAGTAVGTGFLIAAGNTSSVTTCPYSTSCAEDSENAGDAWRSRATAATVSYGIGFAGLITAGVLWLLHEEPEARSSVALGKVELEPQIHPTGASVSGRF